MNKAINANRHEFVNLLFKIKKIDLKEFLATQELYSFYSNVNKFKFIFIVELLLVEPNLVEPKYTLTTY